MSCTFWLRRKKIAAKAKNEVEIVDEKPKKQGVKSAKKAGVKNDGSTNSKS